MRVLSVAIVCLLSLLGPAAADDAKKEAPKKPAPAMTADERAAALKEANAYDARFMVLYKAAKYREAAELARKALTLRERALGPEHPEVATNLSNLAAMLKGSGAYKEARLLFERALRISKKALGPDHVDVAGQMNNLADLLIKTGAFKESRALSERALEITEKALGPDHPDVGGNLNNLAMALLLMGAYKEARPLLERALRINEKALGPNHPNVAGGLINLAAMLNRIGAYEEAGPLFERALVVYEKVLGPQHPGVATCLNNLALNLAAQGGFEEARSLHERALKIRENALGREHPAVGSSLDNLGLLLDSLGAYEEARPLHERALKIREKAFGPQHPRVATSLNNLAGVLHALGDYEQARLLYERAVTIRKQALGPEHPRVAEALTNLATLLYVQGAYEEARPILERALAIQEETLGPDHPHVSISLNSLSALLYTLGAYDQARPLIERVIKIREDALGPEHFGLARSLNNLGSLYAESGEHQLAWPPLSRCLDIVEKHVRSNVAGLQASEQLALMRSMRTYLKTSLEVAPHVGRTGHEEVLRFKGLLARVATAERKLARSGGAAKRVHALLASERRLAKIANSPPPFRQKARKKKWQEAYAKAAAEREVLSRALAKDFAPLRAGLERLDLKLSDIQAALPADSVLVDYLRSDDTYIAWIVQHTGRVERVELGKAGPIEAAAEAFAEQAANPDDAAWRTAGTALRKLILTPILKHAGKGVTTLYICPDAALAAVPFSALPGEGRSIVGAKYTFSAISMAQDLVPWRDAPKSGVGAFLLGGVDYGNATASAAAAHPRVIASRAPRGGNYLYLAGTKAEVLAIKPALGAGVDSVLGADATEDALRRKSKGKRVLHLATHGFVRVDLMRGLTRGGKSKKWLGAALERQLAGGHDPMNLSGLAMAGANTRNGGGDDDGILTALEASHLDLDGVALVVLSACETALGTAESGEGVIGLVRGFQMAGAGQVIGSLWRVDDEATKTLMLKFYELWSPKKGQGLGAAAALKQAQKSVRNQQGGKWKHPYYWAAWVVWGVD